MDDPPVRGAVLGWMPASQRSATLAERLGLDLVLFRRPGLGRRWTAPIAYAWLALRTAILILRRRPEVLVVVAPPFVAPLIAVPLARLIRSRVVVDAHSGALLDRRWTGSGPLLRWAARSADAAVVTLPQLRQRLRRDALVVPDPLPEMETDAPPIPGLVVGICGWAPDEPINALVDSARHQPWELVLTGDATRGGALPPNVRLSGFLPTTEYRRLLGSAACVVVLTTREDTLLSGMWEAVALGRPLVTSDTQALRATLGEAARYAKPVAASIAGAIEASLADPDGAARMRDARAHLRRSNDEALEHLRRALEGPRARG